jgi:hypothetical protein
MRSPAQLPEAPEPGSGEPPLRLPPGIGEPSPLPPAAEQAALPWRLGRRRLHIALIAALAIVVVAVPLVLLLVLRSDEGPDRPAPSGIGAIAPATAAPSATAAQSAPTGRPAAPDGRIAPRVLANATLMIPPWPTDNVSCPGGRLTFHNGEYTVPPDSSADFERHMLIGHSVYGDVDADGAQETVAEIDCFVQGGSSQIVAFDRDAVGAIITLGTVVATTGEIRTLDFSSGRIHGNSTVDVLVGDYQSCCGDETPQLWQTRGYRWDGGRFRQVTGPTAFGVNPSVADFATSATDLVLGPAVDGVRHGTVSFTVTYLRGAQPDHLVLTFYGSQPLERDGSAWPAVHDEDQWSFAVDLPAPPRGTAVTFTFAFRRAASATKPDSVALRLSAVDRAGQWLGDPSGYNNTSGFPVHTEE